MTDTNENQRYNTSEHHQDNLNDDDDVHSSTNNNSIAMLTQFFKTTGLIDKSKLIDVVRNKQGVSDADDDEEETETMTMTTTSVVVVDNAAAHGNSYTESSRWNRIKRIPCLCDYFNRRDGRGGLVIISNNRHRTRQQHKQINLAPPPSRWEPWPGKKSAVGGGSHNNNNNNTSKRNGIGTGGGGVKSSLTMKKPVRQRSIVTAPVEIPSFEEMMSNSNGNIDVGDSADDDSSDNLRPPLPGRSGLPRQGSGSIVCDLSPQQTHSIKMPVRQRSLENKNDNNNNNDNNHHSSNGGGGPATPIISASNTSTSPTKKTTTFWGSKKNSNNNNETSIPRPLSIGGVGGGGPRGGGRNKKLNTRYCSTPAKMPRRQKSIAQCALSAVTEEALFGDTKSEPFTTTPSADERSESPPPPAAPPLRRAETSPQPPPRHIDYGPPELVKEQKEAMFIHRRMARNRKRQGAVVIKASGHGGG